MRRGRFLLFPDEFVTHVLEREVALISVSGAASQMPKKKYGKA